MRCTSRLETLVAPTGSGDRQTPPQPTRLYAAVAREGDPYTNSVITLSTVTVRLNDVLVGDHHVVDTHE